MAQSLLRPPHYKASLTATQGQRAKAWSWDKFVASGKGGFVRLGILRYLAPCSILLLALMFVLPERGHAIPAFSRLYQTSCSTCHLDFPKLNDFGKAFKDAGFKFPKDDESMLKVPPVMLGAPAQKDVWPKAIWPGEIPGLPPIGLRFNTFFQVTTGNRNAFNWISLAQGAVPQFIPATDFQTGFFSIFTA